MKIGEPVSDEAPWLAVAESELFSRRFAQGLGARIPESLNERLRYSSTDEWSEADRHAIVEAVRSLDAPAPSLLRGSGGRWFEGTLEATDLAELRTPPLGGPALVATDGRLSTLVSSLEAGLDTPGAEFSGGFRRLMRTFLIRQMRGRPCLLAPRAEGPFTVVEGLTRLAVALARSRTENPLPMPLAVFLGITESAGEPAAPSLGTGVEGVSSRAGVEPAGSNIPGKETPGVPVKPGPSSSQ